MESRRKEGRRKAALTLPPIGFGSIRGGGGRRIPMSEVKERRRLRVLDDRRKTTISVPLLPPPSPPPGNALKLCESVRSERARKEGKRRRGEETALTRHTQGESSSLLSLPIRFRGQSRYENSHEKGSRIRVICLNWPWKTSYSRLQQ